MSTWEFPASEPVELQVRVLDGDITVSAVAAQTATVTIDDDEGDEFLPGTRVEFDDGKLSVVGRGPLGLGHGSVDDQGRTAGGLVVPGRYHVGRRALHRQARCPGRPHDQR